MLAVGWAALRKPRRVTSGSAMRSQALFLFFVASGLFVLGGCSPSAPMAEGEGANAAPKMPERPGREVDMTIQDYMFMPSEIIAKPGEKLHLVMTNKGKEEHSI